MPGKNDHSHAEEADSSPPPPYSAAGPARSQGHAPSAPASNDGYRPCRPLLFPVATKVAGERYNPHDPMCVQRYEARWEELRGAPGTCCSTTGGTFCSTRGGMWCSDRSGVCCSDRGGVCCADKGGYCCS